MINATFVAIRGSPSALDLSFVQTKSQSYYAFLILGKCFRSSSSSINTRISPLTIEYKYPQLSLLIITLGWGLISDIDILSESLRFLGETRLYAAAVYFILRRRYYKGKLSMLVEGTASSSYGSTSTTTVTKANASAGFSLPHFDVPLSATGDIEQGGVGEGANCSWKTIEGDFLLVWVVQTSHASASMYSGPGATLDDGMFTIFVVEQMSRCEILQLLVGVDSGDHAIHPKVQTYKAKAYRLEPLTDQGIFSLDGEVVEYGPIQASILPGAARILKL